MDNELQVKEYVTQGAVLSSQDKHEEALEYYDKALALDPMSTDALVYKGITLICLDRLDEARAELEKALKLDKSLGRAYFHIANIDAMQGNTDDAIENYNKAVSGGFENAQLYNGLAMMYEAKSDYEMAVRYYNKALIQDPMRSDIRVRKVNILINTGHNEEALQALDEMLAANPHVYDGYHLKFTVLLGLNRTDEAEETIKAGIALFPADASFRLDLARLYTAKGQTDDAMKLLGEIEKGLGDDDDAIEMKRRICMERAQIYAIKDDMTASIAELNRGKEMVESAGFVDDQLLYLLATCQSSVGQYSEALNNAQELLEQLPESDRANAARYYIAMCMKAMGQTEQAKQKYQEAIDELRKETLEDPGNVSAYLMRILCLRDIEQYDKALEILDYVDKLIPNSQDAKMLRIAIYESQGRTDEAKAIAESISDALPAEVVDEIRKEE